MTTIGSSHAKTHLARLLDEVAQGKTVSITRRGREVARLVPASRRSARPDEVIGALRAGRRGVRRPLLGAGDDRHGPPLMTSVIDTSVTMAWCFEDEATATADGVLDRLRDGDAVVPSLWQLEGPSRSASIDDLGANSAIMSLRWLTRDDPSR